MALNTTTVSLAVVSGETTTVGITTNQLPVSYTFTPTTAITSGTGANAAQKAATVSASVGTGGTSYDFTALAGGPANANVAFTKVKLIVVENTSATIAITVTTSGSNGWVNLIPSGVVTIAPGGCFFFYAPDATGVAVASNNKILAIASASSTVAIKIVVVGEGS